MRAVRFKQLRDSECVINMNVLIATFPVFGSCWKVFFLLNSLTNHVQLSSLLNHNLRALSRTRVRLLLSTEPHENIQRIIHLHLEPGKQLCRFQPPTMEDGHHEKDKATTCLVFLRWLFSVTLPVTGPDVKRAELSDSAGVRLQPLHVQMTFDSCEADMISEAAHDAMESHRAHIHAAQWSFAVSSWLFPVPVTFALSLVSRGHGFPPSAFRKQHSTDFTVCL